MSGGSKSLERAFKGDGMAWRREQEDVLAHAKQLGYDRAGGSIISPTDNKQDWESWRNDFVNWKNKNVALEPEGKAFWQQGSASAPSAPSAPLARVEVGPSPIQEAAQRNVYFPMLVPEYSAPQALDYSAYTGMSPFGGQGGLLYQPGTQQYREAFPIADNILSYQPPQLGFPQVTYSNPIVLGLIEEGLGGGGGSPETTPSNGLTDLDMRGGRYGEPDTPLAESQRAAAMASAISKQQDRYSKLADVASVYGDHGGAGASGDFGDPGVAAGEHVG
jgi:hypothetical protein